MVTPNRKSWLLSVGLAHDTRLLLALPGRWPPPPNRPWLGRPQQGRDSHVEGVGQLDEQDDAEIGFRSLDTLDDSDLVGRDRFDQVCLRPPAAPAETSNIGSDRLQDALCTSVLHPPAVSVERSELKRHICRIMLIGIFTVSNVVYLARLFIRPRGRANDGGAVFACSMVLRLALAGVLTTAVACGSAVTRRVSRPDPLPDEWISMTQDEAAFVDRLIAEEPNDEFARCDYWKQKRSQIPPTKKQAIEYVDKKSDSACEPPKTQVPWYCEGGANRGICEPMRTAKKPEVTRDDRVLIGQGGRDLSQGLRGETGLHCYTHQKR